MNDKAASVEGVSDERCVHGVWKGDHCYWCESQPTPSQGSGERELPPLEITEEDRQAAIQQAQITFGDSYSPYSESCLNFQLRWSERNCRERQLKAALAANADLERRIDDWESTLSMAGCWKDSSVPVGWVNRRAEEAEAANAAEYERGFNRCKELAERIVDEHEGFLDRIGSLDPVTSRAESEGL